MDNYLPNVRKRREEWRKPTEEILPPGTQLTAIDYDHRDLHIDDLIVTRTIKGDAWEFLRIIKKDPTNDSYWGDPSTWDGTSLDRLLVELPKSFLFSTRAQVWKVTLPAAASSSAAPLVPNGGAGSAAPLVPNGGAGSAAPLVPNGGAGSAAPLVPNGIAAAIPLVPNGVTYDDPLVRQPNGRYGHYSEIYRKSWPVLQGQPFPSIELAFIFHEKYLRAGEALVDITSANVKTLKRDDILLKNLYPYGMFSKIISITDDRIRIQSIDRDSREPYGDPYTIMQNEIAPLDGSVAYFKVVPAAASSPAATSPVATSPAATSPVASSVPSYYDPRSYEVKPSSCGAFGCFRRGGSRRNRKNKRKGSHTKRKRTRRRR